MTIRSACIASCLLLVSQLAHAQSKAPKPPQSQEQNKPQETDVKEVSGMSIVGNSETPKSLTIIPWKSSEIGQSNDLRRGLLDSGLDPVNRDVFLRELKFHNLSSTR